MKICLTMFVLLGSLTRCSLSESHHNEERRVSVITELQRMSTIDHFYQENDYRFQMYSSFHPEGGNPDRLHWLYEEDGWHVIADPKGPGVCPRIWTTHGEEWGDIRIEVDGKVLYEGNAEEFFDQQKFPFSSPFCEIRTGLKSPPAKVRASIANGELIEKRSWAISYMPITFKSRFRYMHSGEYYTQVEVKTLKEGTKVESYNDVDWGKVRPQWENTATIWKRKSFYSEDQLKDYEKVSRKLTLAAGTDETPGVQNALKINQAGIIRAIRVKFEPELGKYLSLQTYWDGVKKPNINTSLRIGLGSTNRQTMALGRNIDGWSFIYLPMPFRKSADVNFSSTYGHPLSIDVEIYYERKESLPENTMYIHCWQHGDCFLKDKNKYLFPDVPKKEFLYHNGYTVLDVVGSGQIAAYLDWNHSQQELDEHIFIDGEREFPGNSWNGTGHEDVFDTAWGHKMRSEPMTSGGSDTMEEVNVRLYWNDLVPFTKDFRWNWEWSFLLSRKQPPRDATFESVIYWYSKLGNTTVIQPPIYNAQ